MKFRESRKTLSGTFVRLEPSDAEHLLGLERNFDPILFQFYPRTDYQNAHEFCDENLECERKGDFEPYAIIDQKSYEAIGCVEFSSIDHINRKLEIGGSWLGLQFQGGPWNCDTKLLLLTEAFEARKLIRVQFATDSLNLQSQSALNKIGAKLEGILRNHSIQPDGRIRHNAYFSIISDEWSTTKLYLEDRLNEKIQHRRLVRT